MNPEPEKTMARVAEFTGGAPRDLPSRPRCLHVPVSANQRDLRLGLEELFLIQRRVSGRAVSDLAGCGGRFSELIDEISHTARL